MGASEVAERMRALPEIVAAIRVELRSGDALHVLGFCFDIDVLRLFRLASHAAVARSFFVALGATG